MNSRVLTLILVILGLLLVALITRCGDLAWMTLPLLSYLAVGILQAPSLEETRLCAVRSVNANQIGGRTEVEVSVAICNEGALIPQLCLLDPTLPGMRIKDGQVRHATALFAGEETRLEYTFRAERGRLAWTTVVAVASDRLGLFELELVCAAGAEVLIQPELNRFHPPPVRPPRTLPSAGSIPARLGGSGTDFWCVREYHPGDPLRQLDWRLMGPPSTEILYKGI